MAFSRKNNRKSELSLCYAGMTNNVMPTTVSARLMRLFLPIFSRKQSQPRTAVRKITIPESSGNWIEESIVRAQRREKMFPSPLHSA